MNKDRIVFKDKSEIELVSGASIESIQVISSGREEMVSEWGKFTEENLSSVQILNGSGLVCGTYSDLLLVSETSVEQEDGAILTTFRLREKTDLEKRLDVLDDAVGDLGAVTSALAEQVGGEE